MARLAILFRVGVQSDEYKAHAAQAAASEDLRAGGAAAHKRAVVGFDKRIAAVTAELEKLASAREKAQAEYTSALAALDEASLWPGLAVAMCPSRPLLLPRTEGQRQRRLCCAGQGPGAAVARGSPPVGRGRGR
jgi:hypothetical protein